jgi:hypothetical protein
MDDLSQRDLSQIPDEELSPEERHELKRRFDDLVDRLRERVGMGPAKKPKKKPKRVARWDPSATPRRH